MGNCVCYSKNIPKIVNNNSKILKFPLELDTTPKENSPKKSLSFSKIKKIFTSYNILDYENNIILGIWDNPSKLSNLGNQGIWIGGHDKIYELVFGLICLDTIVLNFENNIKLKIYKINSSDIFIELTYENKNQHIKQLDNTVIKNLQKINNKSDDIDLIFLIL